MGMTPEDAFTMALATSMNYTRQTVKGLGAIKGVKGDDGKSAYQVAVDNGYSGTEQEWLASLKGTAIDTRKPVALNATKTKTSYSQGEPILTDDLVVQVTFDDGTTENVAYYTTNVSELDTFTAGLKRLIVDYYSNGVKVSNTVNLNVSFDESYDKIQYSYKIANAGAIRSQTTLLGLNTRIYQYSQMRLKLKLHIIIEQNNNANPTTIKIENSAFVANTVFGRLTIPAYEVGDFEIVVNTLFEYKKDSIDPPMDLVYLKCDGSEYVSGMFETIDYSLALVSAVKVVPVSIVPSKVSKYFITGEDVEYSDITAEVTFNNGTTQSFGANELIIGIDGIDTSKTGDQKLSVGYSQNGKKATQDITLHFFAHDKTEPDEFIDLTADEWYNSWNYGINFGNCFDPWGTGYLATGYFPNSLEGDRFLDGTKGQEIHWNQPKITQQNVQELVDAGFEMVRIPITWYVNSYITKEYLGTFDEDGNEDFIPHYHVGRWFLYRICEVVDWCLDAGLKVLINTHHDSKQIFDLGVNDSLLEKKCHVATEWWTEIAEKFKYHNQNLAFEGFNEIDNLKLSWTPSIDAQLQMNQLNQVFVDAVRSTGANNLHRILVCPFLIHRVTKMLSDVFVVPHDIGDEQSEVSNYIGTAVHWYPKEHTQGIDVLMSQIEGFRTQLSIPVMINEYGLPIDYSLDERIKYYVNYISRAKQHNVKTVIWDNGTNYNVVKKHNASGKGASSMTFEESQRLCEAIAQGYNTNTAYALPSSQVYVYENTDTIVSGEFNSDGTIHSATWTNFVTKDFIPCRLGQTISILCNRVSEHSARKKLCVGSCAFYDANYNFIRTVLLGSSKNQIAEATLVNEDAAFFKVQFFCASGTPTLRSLSELDEYMFSKGDSCIISVFNENDEYEVTLLNRVPYQIKSLQIVEPGQYNSLGQWIKEPKYILDIVYDEGATHLTYYSGGRLNLGNAHIVSPTLTEEDKGTYECSIAYTYNGTTIEMQDTGIFVKVGKYLVDVEFTNPTNLTFDCATQNSETIKSLIAEGLVVRGIYTDDTSEILTSDEYNIDYSAVTFNEPETYTITVTVNADGNTFTHTFDIIITTSEFIDYYIAPTHSKKQILEWNNAGVTEVINQPTGAIVGIDSNIWAFHGYIVYCVETDRFYIWLNPNYHSYSESNGYTYVPYWQNAVIGGAKGTSKQQRLVYNPASSANYVSTQGDIWLSLASHITSADNVTATSNGIKRIQHLSDLDNFFSDNS